MKEAIFTLPIVLALVIAPAISVMIFVRTGESFRDLTKGLLVFGVWCVISLLMTLVLLGYVSAGKYVIGYEPPVTRALKYLGLVAAYGVIGLALLRGLKGRKPKFQSPRGQGSTFLS